MITQKRMCCVSAVDRMLSSSCTSSADLTFGIMIEGGGDSVSMMACRSFNPCSVVMLLMRTMRSTFGMRLLREQRQRELAPFVLAIERNGVFEVHADDIGPGVERLRVAVGTQAGTNSRTRRGRMGGGLWSHKLFALG
jgi:hypothetical protein